MNLVSTNSILSFSGYGDSLTEAISFQVSSESVQKISIGETHSFGCRTLELGGKIEVTGRFVIEKMTPSNIKHNQLNDEKIGVVRFYDASDDEFGHYSSPAKIYFRVFVEEKDFENIRDAVIAGVSVAYITCSLDGMDFDWEPDGSHQLWKLKEGKTSVSHTSLTDVAITSFSIGFGNSFDDDYVYKPDASKSNSSIELMTKNDIEQFKKHQIYTLRYLAVIAGILVAFALKVLL